MDFTAIPRVLDARMELLDEDSALRPTIIKVSDGAWKKKVQDGLLSKPTWTSIVGEKKKSEKDYAFDLLDALSRSGVVSIDCASLHVVLAATHCFDKTLINTVIQGNVNPVEKVERSSLILATTIQNKPASELVKRDQISRLQMYSPMFFPQLTDQ